MITAGLCLMGGCFTQDENTAAVDTYWAAEKVAVPTYTASSSLGVYEFSTVPAGVQLADCYVYTKQIVQTGDASFFFVLQNEIAVYNAYSWQGSGGVAPAIQSLIGGSVTTEADDLGKFPMQVRLTAGPDGITCEAFSTVSLGPCKWDSTQPGTRLRMLDARASEKDFYVSHGAWGWKWYLLPMRSPGGATEAVFDFEEKVLVEL